MKDSVLLLHILKVKFVVTETVVRPFFLNLAAEESCRKCKAEK